MKSNKDYDKLDKDIMDGIAMHAEEFADKYPNSEDLAEVTYSKKHSRKMERMLKRHNSFFYGITATPKRVLATICVCVFVALNALIFSNTEVRAFISDFFLENFGEFGELYFHTETERLVDIETYYSPNYVPEGYEITLLEHTPSDLYIEYMNGDKYITYDQDLVAVESTHINTEASNIETIEINGNEALCIYDQRYEYYRIYWADGPYKYRLSGGDKEELVKMAESLEIHNFD